MANRKNRKFVVKNSNNIEKATNATAEKVVSTMERPSVAAKLVLSSRVNEVSPAIMGRSTHIASEIKRSVICAAITLTALIALYFIFK